MSTLVAIGTKKGLWFARSEDRQNFTLSGPHFFMEEVPSISIDTRGETPHLMAGVRSEHFGPTVYHSWDLGETWSEPETAAIAFPKDADTAVERIWQIQPGDPAHPDEVWAGVEPTSLWKSTDGGQTFRLNQALWDHPHRQDWFPGAGGAAVHSIVPDGEVLTVAMSTGGVYRSEDAGDTWNPRNKGISAYFLPDPLPEYGQCVHKIAADPANPHRFYAQNHRGVYRTDNAGETWESIEEGLPANFGFNMIQHPSKPGTIWVIPLVSDGERIPVDGKLAVHRSQDGGDTWERFSAGLPDFEQNVVLRDAATVDDGAPAGIYLGTRGGAVYASADNGETYRLIADHLADVLCIRAATI
ncbi:WD40/YVTN/BNR-like repeat-containing protein [Haematomicrobium sanguinis]|uniref:WD40/YVTN/BNR-like repeat-containing protein n=1 Tax=Haematomicrobium sanguinis TaxID=479106 RepID=UPI00047A044F|nr:glycosyl hydrolase [Haematomicrobium sanguinis]